MHKCTLGAFAFFTGSGPNNLHVRAGKNGAAEEDVRERCVGDELGAGDERQGARRRVAKVVGKGRSKSSHVVLHAQNFNVVSNWVLAPCIISLTHHVFVFFVQERMLSGFEGLHVGNTVQQGMQYNTLLGRQQFSRRLSYIRRECNGLAWTNGCVRGFGEGQVRVGRAGALSCEFKRRKERGKRVTGGEFNGR